MGPWQEGMCAGSTGAVSFFYVVVFYCGGKETGRSNDFWFRLTMAHRGDAAHGRFDDRLSSR